MMTGLENYACTLGKQLTEEKVKWKVAFRGKDEYEKTLPLENYTLHTIVGPAGLVTRLTLIFPKGVYYDEVEQVIESDYLRDWMSEIQIFESGNYVCAPVIVTDMEFVSLTETLLPFGNTKSLMLELAHVVTKKPEETLRKC